jgi:hypothetical protein
MKINALSAVTSESFSLDKGLKTTLRDYIKFALSVLPMLTVIAFAI